MVKHKMTKTKAHLEANNEVSMHQLGGMWIITVWDNEFRAWREMTPRSYSAARAAVRDLRAERALWHLGYKDAVINAGAGRVGDLVDDYIRKHERG